MENKRSEAARIGFVAQLDKLADDYTAGKITKIDGRSYPTGWGKKYGLTPRFAMWLCRINNVPFEPIGNLHLVEGEDFFKAIQASVAHHLSHRQAEAKEVKKTTMQSQLGLLQEVDKALAALKKVRQQLAV